MSWAKTLDWIEDLGHAALLCASITTICGCCAVVWVLVYAAATRCTA